MWWMHCRVFVKGYFERLENRPTGKRIAVIGVIGLGYEGLPLVLSFAEAWYRVLGFDTDAAKIDKLATGLGSIRKIATDKIAAMAADDRFEGTTDFNRAEAAGALIICVPAPPKRASRAGPESCGQLCRCIVPNSGFQ